MLTLLEDPYQQNQKFQWISGEHIGKVETVNCELDEFTFFESGRRIYTNMIGEMMTPANGELLIDEVIDEGTTDVQLQQPTDNVQPPTDIAKEKISPVIELLKKMKNPETIEVNVQVKVNVPSEGMFSLLRDSFEDELESDFKKFVSDQIDDKKIKEAINESIQNILNEYKS